MLKKLRFVVGALLFASALACGDDKPPPVLGLTGGTGGSSGRGFDGGGSAGKDGGVDGGDGGQVVGAPIVSITSPAHLAQLADGEVLTSIEIEVLCTARQSNIAGAKAVNESSVRLELLDAADKKLFEVPGTPTTNPNEFRARFVLTTVPSGRVSFRCTASDRSEPPRIGSSTIQSFVDHGPAITVAAPLPDSARALKAPVSFQFSVLAAPLVDPDPAAAVDSVKFSVDGVDIVPNPDPSKAGYFEFSVDFNDRRLFPQIPTGSIPVVISAANRRTPTAVMNTLAYNFALDGTGPIIDITAPAANTVVGGEIVLEFTVTDLHAGVKKDTVVVELGIDKHPFDAASGAWSEKDGKFTFRFDSTTIDKAESQVTINIGAADTVGNDSPGQSYLLYLDNQPPIVDLDPGNVRERVKEGTSFFCSSSFDPLGKAANDQQKVETIQIYRALLWEVTNFALGQTVLHYAGLDNASVYLYLQSDLSKPLVVDTNGDGTCDDVPENLRLTLPYQVLSGVTPAGSAFFGDDPAFAPALAGCSFKSQLPPQPDPDNLCTLQASDLERAINFALEGSQPAVFGVGNLQGLECTGAGWEIGSLVGREGWVCLAARAKDNVGNVGVSRPLRVCLTDSNSNNGTPCESGTTPPPTCDDGCAVKPATFPSVILDRR